SKSIFHILEDPTRFKIFIFLLIQDELTLLNLAQRINKSKTTIFHHMKTGFGILEEEPELISWIEKEEGRRLKTKYFSLNTRDKYWKTEIDSYLNSSDFLERLIGFAEEQGYDLQDNNIKTFTITNETRYIYEEFERKMEEMSDELETAKSRQKAKSEVVRIYSHVSIPIEEILEKISQQYRE
ncbi:MAG: winged helix-turn-helix domain-containing protein, partial [Candidatus Hodarchaeota archaeon]